MRSAVRGGIISMTPENFVNQIQTSIVDENLAIYKDLFSGTDIRNASDPYWVAHWDCMGH